MTYLSVRDAAARMSKSEETIKRWLRSGKFPNAFKVSDKGGWKIPLSDLNGQIICQPHHEQTSMELSSPMTFPTNNDEMSLISLAFQAVTLTSPSNEILEVLSSVGIGRTLEILLVMQQSPTKVKNPLGFIKRAIQEGWSPLTLPKKIDRRWQNIEERLGIKSSTHTNTFTFYNWLEDE
ncbi:MAG: helix-turn-helix domain-containing protein [Desulfosporosinus sp.]|nr:helix-turn-helix domain-containing protein [Desulfosporosinus sp.]